MEFVNFDNPEPTSADSLQNLEVFEDVEEPQSSLSIESHLPTESIPATTHGEQVIILISCIVFLSERFVCLLSFEEAGRHYAIVCVMSCNVM